MTVSLAVDAGLLSGVFGSAITVADGEWPPRPLESPFLSGNDESHSETNWLGSRLPVSVLFAIDDALNRGIAVSVNTLQYASAFVRCLPAGMPTPDVTIEDDGEIAFDWQPQADLAMSVSVGEGVIGFAALIDRQSIHGRTPFVGRIPEALAFLLSALVRSQARSH